jgi:hypothetical protein
MAEFVVSVGLKVQWGEPVSTEYLRAVGITIEGAGKHVVFIPGERPDLAEELSPGSTRKPPALIYGRHVYILDVPDDAMPENTPKPYLH